MGARSPRIFHLLTSRSGFDPAAGQRPVPGDPPIASDQFERHGFVHCCFREQLVEIATWWFDPTDELVALELDPSRLTAELRLEASPTRWYPHLYGPIDAGAVAEVHAVPRSSAGGSAELPPGLREPVPGYQLTGIVEGASRTVRWCADGRLEGDERWCELAHAALVEGRTVELLGGIVVPATLDAAYESFALLTELTDDGAVVRYDGDGFF
jgi:glutathione S-transferase